MKKDSKRKKILKPPQDIADRIDSPDSPDIAVIIDRMQQQLVNLEKKIDTLINRPQDRPAEERRFSKPSNNFDRSGGYSKENRDNRFRERSFTRVICADCKQECEVPFRPSGDRPVYCKDCFAKRKEGGSFKGGHDNKIRDEGSVQGHHFVKHRGSARPRPGEEKKPGFRKRKGRA